MEPNAMYKHFFKRLIDIVLSLCGMIVLAIPMVIIAIVIKIDSPGPVLFKQKRVGIHKTHFTIFKFRSMYVDEENASIPTHLLKNPESKITKVGNFLRKSSLDEIPQLFNMIKGNMSIIGPRPALWNQYDLIEERDKYDANDVKPGLTGWAQINGRDALDISDKARFDGEYVKNMSFAFDCKCFFGTIVSVLKRDGVVEGDTSEIKKYYEEQEEKEKEAINK